MFLNLGILRNVPRDPGSQFFARLHTLSLASLFYVLNHSSNFSCYNLLVFLLLLLFHSSPFYSFTCLLVPFVSIFIWEIRARTGKTFNVFLFFFYEGTSYWQIVGGINLMNSTPGQVCSLGEAKTTFRHVKGVDDTPKHCFNFKLDFQLFFKYMVSHNPVTCSKGFSLTQRPDLAKGTITSN